MEPEDTDGGEPNENQKPSGEANFQSDEGKTVHPPVDRDDFHKRLDEKLAELDKLFERGEEIMARLELEFPQTYDPDQPLAHEGIFIICRGKSQELLRPIEDQGQNEPEQAAKNTQPDEANDKSGGEDVN